MALQRSRKLLLRGLREAGVEMGTEGRQLTGLIGELSACDLLEPLTWKHSSGCVAKAGGTRFQIKARRPGKGDQLEPRGEISRHRVYSFDQDLFVELDSKFEVVRIWQMSAKAVKEIEETKRKKGIRIVRYRKRARLVYSRLVEESPSVRELVWS